MVNLLHKNYYVVKEYERSTSRPSVQICIDKFKRRACVAIVDLYTWRIPFAVTNLAIVNHMVKYICKLKINRIFKGAYATHVTDWLINFEPVVFLDRKRNEKIWALSFTAMEANVVSIKPYSSLSRYLFNKEKARVKKSKIISWIFLIDSLFFVHVEFFY